MAKKLSLIDAAELALGEALFLRARGLVPVMSHETQHALAAAIKAHKEAPEPEGAIMCPYCLDTDGGHQDDCDRPQRRKK